MPLQSYRQDDEEDVLVKYALPSFEKEFPPSQPPTDMSERYHPAGQQKFGALSIQTPTWADQSQLTYRLFVDGKEAWRYLIQTPPAIRGKSRGKDALWG